MAEICRGVALNNTGKNPVISSSCETSSTQAAARRRRMEIRRFKFVAGVSTPDESEIIGGTKRQRIEITRTTSCSSECIENCVSDVRVRDMIKSSSDNEKDQNIEPTTSFYQSHTKSLGLSSSLDSIIDSNENCINGVPKFGVASVCGRRRDMEDAVAIHPSFFRSENNNSDLHYFGVYDGHGCSHVHSLSSFILFLILRFQI